MRREVCGGGGGCCVGEVLTAYREDTSAVEDIRQETNVRVEEVLSPEEAAIIEVLSKTVKEEIETMEDVRAFLNRFNRSPYVRRDEFIEEESSINMAYVVQRLNEFTKNIPGFAENELKKVA